MATLERPLKEGSVRTYQAKVGLGFLDILANEVDADVDTIYAAWNGGIGVDNLDDGAVTYAKLAPDAQLWRDTGTTLVPGTNFPNRNLQTDGTRLRLGTPIAADVVQVANILSLTINDPNTPQDVAKAGWTLRMAADGDFAQLLRKAPGAAAGVIDFPWTLYGNGDLTVTGGTLKLGTGMIWHTQPGAFNIWANHSAAIGYNPAYPLWDINIWYAGDEFKVLRNTVPLFTVSNLGNLTISGSIAVKATGTTWANPSDSRIKQHVTDYTAGLAEVLALRPIRFEYNGLAGTTDGQVAYGYLADDLARVLPETVHSRRVKLQPDDADETDLQLLDPSNVSLAVVNAIQELAARVAALEAAAP